MSDNCQQLQKNTLNSNQKRALTALLSSPSIRAAALACKLSERTLYGYLQLPDFKAELRARQDAVLLSVTSGLAGLSGSAVEVLQGVLSDPDTSASVRVRAALGWLSEVRRGIELEALADRVSQLEQGTGGAK